jgi:hypothetical protein
MTLSMHAVVSVYSSWIGLLSRFMSTEIRNSFFSVVSSTCLVYHYSPARDHMAPTPCFVDPLLSRSRSRLPRLRDIRASRKPPCDVYWDDCSVCNSPRSYARWASTSTANIVFWNLALTFSTSMIFTHNGSSGTDYVVNRLGVDMVCIGSSS